MGFDINHVTISGNLTRDPELRSTASGVAVCSLRIAHNERRYNQATQDYDDVPGYYDVTVWKGLGEWLSKNLSKGDKIVCSGGLRWREWEDQSGNKRQAVEINAFDVVPVPRDGGGGGRGGGGFAARSDVPVDAADFKPRETAGATAGRARPDDDIPF